MLENIVKVASTLPFGTTFVPLYLLCFFSFLRLSNILPHTVNSFDITRQLARGDILYIETGAIVVIKWSKTLQDRKQLPQSLFLIWVLLHFAQLRLFKNV